MKTGLLKILWLISGVLLIFAGILSFVYPASAILTLAFVLGLVMLICGALEIAGYFTMKDFVLGSGWVLMDGTLTVLLSFFLLFNQIVTASVIPYVFGMWMLFSGVAHLVSASDMKKLRLSGWGWMLILGIVGIVLGFVSFIKPIATANVLGVMMGLIFIVQGAAAIYMVWLSPRFPSEKL